MTAPVPDALPYGLRQVMLTPYLDEQGTVLAAQSYPLPVAMTLAFSETEQFDEMRGDDKLIAVHGRGPQVDWSLESGGLPITPWSIITGGSVVEEGTAPTRQIILRKSWDDMRPYFRIDGRVISDSGGNIVARIYRCKANGRIRGDHKYGAFQTSQIDGIGLPLINDDASWLYEIIRNETDTALTGTPDPNPVPIPANVLVGVITGTTVALSWTDITEASGFVVQKSIDGGTTWADIAEGTNAVQTLTISGSPTSASLNLIFGGQTANVAYTVATTAAEIQTALQNLSSIGEDNVEVTGSPGGPFTITFVNALGNAPQATITTTGTTFVGGTSPAATVASTTTGVDGGGTPDGPSTVIDGLSNSTIYLFQVAAIVNGLQGDFCTPVQATTLA